VRLVVFGLTVSSSWGNGHATLWRGLSAALHARGHEVVFYEHDVPYYAAHRDLERLPGGRLRLYRDFADVAAEARELVAGADAVMVTSYCPDAIVASELALDTWGPLHVYYDLDTPVTLGHLAAGEPVAYLPPDGLSGFDLVLSYTGGVALDELCARLGARRVAPLYGSFDPDVHHPTRVAPERVVDLSYLGTYAADRQALVTALFTEPARRLAHRRFRLGGSQYPSTIEWPANVECWAHVAPPDHSSFYASSRMTLNVTRGAMAAMGHCPSGRLFEAAGVGVPILSDTWEGLERFFEPGREILVATRTEDAVAALELPDDELAVIARAARERALAEHTAAHRADELVELLTSPPARSLGSPARAAVRDRYRGED
jgi:spore maturation protein CgeB